MTTSPASTRVCRIPRSSKPTSLNCSAAPVAVRAADLALAQLIDQALRVAPASHKRRDVFRLRLKMIELEHKRVREGAIDTRRFAETLQHDANIAPVSCHPRAREFELT